MLSHNPNDVRHRASRGDRVQSGRMLGASDYTYGTGRREAMKRLAAVIAVMIVGAACGNNQTVTPAASPSSEPTKSSPTQTASAEDIASIEDVVRSYFEANAAGNLKALPGFSTGNLREFNLLSNQVYG